LHAKVDEPVWRDLSGKVVRALADYNSKLIGTVLFPLEQPGPFSNQPLHWPTTTQN
jgi:hypothetical protein